MKKIKSIFDKLDKKDLKIMKNGLKVSFSILLIATCLLCINSIYVHSLLLYNIGLSIFKFSTYIAVEFIICGIIVDHVVKQVKS